MGNRTRSLNREFDTFIIGVSSRRISLAWFGDLPTRDQLAIFKTQGPLWEKASSVLKKEFGSDIRTSLIKIPTWGEGPSTTWGGRLRVWGTNA